MTTPATSHHDVRQVASRPSRCGWREPDAAAALAIVFALASLVVSGWRTPAVALVVASVVLALPAALRGVRTLQGALAGAVLIVWPVYGWLVGSLPSMTDLGLIAQWLDTDARFLYPTLLAVSLSGVRNPRWFTRALVAGFWTVVAGVTSGLVLAPFVDATRSGDLVIGLSSSHHVQGALAMSGILLVVAVPSLSPHPVARIGTGVVMAIGLALSGSRAAALGAVAGCVLVAVIRHRHDRRKLLRAGAVVCVIILVAVATIPRARTTATDLTSGAFISDAVEIFRGQGDDSSAIIREQATANVLTRARLWRRAVDFAAESPLIGAGAFRYNDRVVRHAGVRWVAYPVVDARNAYNDAQAHNTYLHVLAETGAIGLALYLSPWIIAWRRTRPAADGRDTIRTGGAGTAGLGADVISDLRVAARGFLAAGAAAGLVSEGVFSPALGVPVVIVVFGGAAVWSVRDRPDPTHAPVRASEAS